MVQAGVYSSVMHYLKAVEALKSTDGAQDRGGKMKELPTDDHCSARTPSARWPA